MPKLFDWVNKSIADRLVARYLLSDTPEVQRPYYLIRSVQPVTDFDKLLVTPFKARDILDISAAGSVTVVFFTVPKGKRWRIKYIDKGPTTGVSGVVVLIPGDTSAERMSLQAATATAFNQPVDFIMDELWTMGLTSTNNGGDTTRGLSILYEEEDAY